MEEYIPCFACGAKGLNIPGETHRYMLSSPGCWAMYNEVLEKEYSDFQYAKAHHFTVDAYACQHPGEPGSTQASRSVWIHLSSLFMIFNYQMPLQEAANFKSVFSQFEKRRSFIHQLEVPEDLGKVTVFDVWNNEDVVGQILLPTIGKPVSNCSSDNRSKKSPSPHPKSNKFKLGCGSINEYATLALDL